MSDTYYYYQCLNAKCDRAVLVNVRIKDGGKVFMGVACPLCATSMDYCGRSASKTDGYSVKWETVVDDDSQSVRRLAVPTGWIYQTQDGRKYNSVAGTVGRESDLGYPIWGPMVFVPKSAS